MKWTGTGRNVRGRGALVVGSDYVVALGLIRSLGRRGIPVWVLVDDGVAFASRYCARALPWPGVRATDRRKLEYLISLAQQHGLEGWAIYPTGDREAALLARNRRMLSRWFQVTAPDWKVLQVAYDKRQTYRLAAELGIDHPRTTYPSSRDELARLEWSFPLILKPAVKEEWNAFTMARAWPVRSRQELLARYDEACSLVSPDTVMVQELIQGGGESQFSYAGLWTDGHPLASLVARRARQRPIDFGTGSTFVETVHAPAVAQPAERILQAMRYTGLVEVEFKRDSRDGTYKLLDVNPRAWVWHALAQHAGLDLPYMLWQHMYHESLPHVEARVGARWMHLALDIPTAIRLIQGGRLTLRAYVESFGGPPGFATFAADDPLPAVLEAATTAAHALRRRWFRLPTSAHEGQGERIQAASRPA